MVMHATGHSNVYTDSGPAVFVKTCVTLIFVDDDDDDDDDYDQHVASRDLDDEPVTQSVYSEHSLNKLHRSISLVTCYLLLSSQHYIPLPC